MPNEEAHVNKAFQALVGQWVQVSYGGTFDVSRSGLVAVGFVENCDEGFLYLRKPDGEGLFLLLRSIYSIERLEPPQSEESRTLLRAAEKPREADSLLRPARGVEDIDPETLLRPAKDGEEGVT